MSPDAPRHASRGRLLSGRAVAGLAAGLATGFVVVALVLWTGGSTPIDEDLVTTTAEAGKIEGGSTPAAAAARTGAVVPEMPRSAALPSGRTVPIVAVSTTSDGTLDVPSDVNLSGWWRGSSRIGDPFGSTLVSAHVDSTTQGLGPYAELLTVRPGQTIVLTSEHLRQEYVVSSLRLLDKGPLAAHRWVYSATGPHRLTMVTCAGPFVPSRGGYQRLAVVTATAVGQPSQRG